MRFLTVTSISLIGGLALASCVDQGALGPRSSAPTSISASSVAAAGGASSYVIQSTGNAVPAGLADAVRAAGGTLTSTLPQIGVAFAVSSDAGVAARVAKLVVVSSVPAAMVVQGADPTGAAVPLVADVNCEF